LDDATHRQENAAPRPGHDANARSAVQKPPRRQEIVLFPDRFVRIPALGLECLCQRIDRAVVVLLLAFLVAAGLFGQIEFWAAVSSAVEMTGLPIHSNSRSDAPGLSGATRAESSIVSMRPSVGYIWLGRLNVNFSFPVLAFHTVEDDFADSVLDRTFGDRRRQPVLAELIAVAPVGGRKPDRANPSPRRRWSSRRKPRRATI